MKNISLLPPEIRQEKKKRQNYRYYILSGLAVAGIFMFILGTLLTMTASVHSHINSLETQRRAVERQMSELEQYAEMQERAQEAENILRRAMGDIPDWDRLLKEMSISIPGDIWLSDLNAAFAEGSGEIIIRGWTYRHDAVTVWLQKIENIEGLNDVNCRYSEESTLDGKPVVQFEIRGILEPGEPFERMLEGGGF